MDVHECLVDGRNLIVRDGWPTLCVIQAVYWAAPNDAEVRLEATRVLKRLAGAVHLPTWNDAAGRTEQEVLALFAEAIAETADAPRDPFPTMPEFPAVFA